MERQLCQLTCLQDLFEVCVEKYNLQLDADTIAIVKILEIGNSKCYNFTQQVVHDDITICFAECGKVVG